MDTLIFRDKNWAEIPKQDNPTWDFQSNWLRRQECILVMKVLPYEQKSVGVNGYSVIHVPLDKDVVRKGLFWNIEDAILFAEALCNKNALSFK